MLASRHRRPSFVEVHSWKLAEALVLRADAQKRLEQLKQRLLRNAKVQAGDRPGEDPARLLTEFEGVAAELTSLVQRINKTNAASAFQKMSLTDALAVRDTLRVRESMYRELAAAASITQSRTSKSEVKFRSTVVVVRVQK